MADPITLTAVAGGAASLGSGILGAVGAEKSASAQAGMYNYQAGVAQQNATLAKQDSNYTIGEGIVQGQQAGEKTRAEIGLTRAGFGASNVSGASHDAVVSSEVEIGQENEGVIQANTMKRAYGFDVKAAQDTAQAEVYQASASTAKEAGDISALSSIIGSAGSVSSKWLQGSQSFGWGGSGGGISTGPSPDFPYE